VVRLDTAAALLSDKERVEAAERALNLATVELEEAKGSLASLLELHKLGEAMGWPNSVGATDFFDRAQDLATLETIRVVERAIEGHKLTEAAAEVGAYTQGDGTDGVQHPEA
jgi:hypothetical protein